MLLILMYHRIGVGKHSNTLPMLTEHFQWLQNRFPILLPGDPLPKRKLSLCLSFDDATFDFYYYLFPLLKKLQLRVLLGVPVRYILHSTKVSPAERLAVPYSLMMQDRIFEEKAPFCTWEELREMIDAGVVEVASHSFSHANLTFPFVNLEREVLFSKKVLEENLPQSLYTFIYPFGKTNQKIHDYVSSHYRYALRIGSSLNRGWETGKKPLRRVPADQLQNPRQPLQWLSLGKYFFKFLFQSFSKSRGIE